MLTTSHANAALQALARDVGVASLELDQSNTALIAFGDTHELIFHFLPERGGFQFWAPLHSQTLSDEAEADLLLLRHVLQQNFPSVQLGGSYFALDASVGVILLGKFVPLDPATPARFIQETKAFAEQVSHVASGFEDGLKAMHEDLAVPDHPDDDMTFMRV